MVYALYGSSLFYSLAWGFLFFVSVCKGNYLFEAVPQIAL